MLQLTRTLLLGSLAIVLLGIGGCERGAQSNNQLSASDGVSQQKFRWKMVTAWPKNYPGLGTGPERFAQMVDRMSAGRLTVRVYGAGELVPALEVFGAVSRGIAEIGHSGSYYDKGRIPSSPLFSSLPFGMTAQEVNAWLHYGGGLELFQEIYGKQNVLPLPGGNTGVQMGGWFSREINSLADLQGLRMRVPGIGSDVLRSLGVTTVTLPGSELYTAMQTGVIDATEWVGPYNDLALGLQEVAKYYYYPGWQEPGSVVYFGINLGAWNELPPDLQEIVKVAARAVNADMLNEYTARNQDALRQLIDKHGVQLRHFPDEVIDELRRQSVNHIEKLVNREPTAARVYRSYAAFFQKVRQYTRISEHAYLQIRTPPAK